MDKSFANSQDLVDIAEIKNGVVILNDGRMLRVLMVDGVNFSLKSEEEQNILIFGYQTFLNSIDFPTQIIVHSRKINVQTYLNMLTEKEKTEPLPLLKNQISEYREFIASFVQENAIMQKTFLVVVPFSPPIIPKKETFLAFIPFLKKKDGSEQKETLEQKEEKFSERISQLDQRTEQVIGGFSAIGLAAAPLSSEELAELFYNFYNPETTERDTASAQKERR